MKKAPFLAPNIPGFWVNRLLFPQWPQAKYANLKSPYFVR
jgi:hypothetical protein